jgi:SAM-dependent methyltransferase
MPDHKDVVRAEFTRQAQAYAVTPSLTDPERVARLVRALDLPSDARVLEVATGPGHVALILAGSVRAVVGLDLTDAPLVIAEQRRRERGLDNVRFQQGDAERLPFADGEFDVVLCRFAFHHFEDPPLVLREMTRVCRPGGAVAVEDMVVSEHPRRAAYQNHFENLRDPSHTRAFPLSRLLTVFADAGLEVERVSTDRLTPGMEEWMARAQTPPDRAAEVRALIERDERDDLSGCRPFRVHESLHFTQRTAIVVGRKLGRD